MPLRLFNSLTRRTEDFTPADPSRVTFYSCGPTVYDDAHIGNFRSFLAADVLRRWIESPLCELADGKGGVHAGPRRVVHVMNITDVGHMTDDAEGGEQGEDRMAVAGRRLAEAKKAGKIPAGVNIDPADPYQIARFYEDRFKEDGRRLGLKLITDGDKDPALNPRATENVPGMIAVISRLIDHGFAYVTGSPGARVVYFDVQKYAPYGKLSGNTLDQLREGAGGRIAAENQQSKKHPADFLLWKEDPTHIMKWDSPWGKGYPGWHIECTVMSVLGTSGRRAADAASLSHLSGLSLPGGQAIIDLHSGGEDNIFPHHECEMAQSCCAFNAEPGKGTFSRTWFHPRFLLVEGTKMSKSKGNFFTARDLFAKGIEPAALRLELIRTHYRSNANFTMQGLQDAQRRLDRWRRFARQLAARSRMEMPRFEVATSVGSPPSEFRPSTSYLLRLEEAFGEALQNDLNVSSAIAALDTFYSEASEDLRRRTHEVAQESGVAAKETADLPPLDTTPLPVEDALSMIRRGKANHTYEWEWGLLHLIDNVLGVIFAPIVEGTTSDIGVFVGVEPSAAVTAKLEERRAARAAKDFKRSDAIRDELAAMGYAIKDAPGGKVEVRRA